MKIWEISERVLSVVLIVVIICAAASVEVRAGVPEDALPVRSGKKSLLLNGEWKFKYLPSSDIQTDSAFYQPSFDASQWKTIPVPSHWELRGFAEPKYKKVDEGTGLYRKTFRVPSAWRGQRIMLLFDGVQYGFTVWVNGKETGRWASSYNPVTFDVTDALLPGNAENVLAVRVTTRSKGYEFDLNDCWALSGIYREVTLFAVPAARIQDYTLRTSLNADGSAHITVDVAANTAGTVTGRLSAPDGRPAADFIIPLGKNGRGSSEINLVNPQLWTAETPQVYSLTLNLTENAKPVHSVENKVGLREVSVSGTMLKVNGTPVKLRGIDHHDIWPVNGRVATEELLRRDLELMKNANINFIRTSHYPPHPRLIELCDEMGFYVMCEVPFGHGDKNLTDTSFQEVLLTRARATLMRDKNRPSVIVWSIGNENPLTELVVRTAQYTKEIDPSRPVCIPTVGSYFKEHLQQFIDLPAFVDLFAPHYPGNETIRDYAAKLKRPIIFTEYAHALGLATDKIQEQWELMRSYPTITGGAIWLFQDQGILRKADKPVDRAKPTGYAWKDSVHYYDTYGTDGVDGIVYSDRTPQPDYWQVRKVYSPVKISERQLTVLPGQQTVTLTIENRYDFIPLSRFTLKWSLRENGKPLQSGALPLQAKPREKESVSLTITIPGNHSGNMYTLNIQCADKNGASVSDAVIRLDVEGSQAVAEQICAALPGTQEVIVEEQGSLTKISLVGYTASVSMETGEIELRAKDGRVIANAFFPHAGRKFTLAEELRVARPANKESVELDLRNSKNKIWRGVSTKPSEMQPVKISRNGDSVKVTVHGEYQRLDFPDQKLSGEFTMTFTRKGNIEINYAYEPVNAEGAFLETGFSIMLPHTYSEFLWIGKGPYPGYPGKDALNEFGMYQMRSSDINYQGNRREVDAAMCVNAARQGLLITGSRMDVAVESTEQGIVLRHNALLSGRGNKGGGPETNIESKKVKRIAGNFVLLPLQASWPAPLSKWMAGTVKTAKPNQPFYHSYDQ